MAKLKFIRDAHRIIESAGLIVTGTSKTHKTVRVYCRHPASGHCGHIDLLRTSAPCPRAEATVRASARTLARGTYNQSANGVAHVGA